MFSAYAADPGGLLPISSRFGTVPTQESIPVTTPERLQVLVDRSGVEPVVYVVLPPHLVGVGKPYPLPLAQYTLSGDQSDAALQSFLTPDASGGLGTQRVLQRQE